MTLCKKLRRKNFLNIKIQDAFNHAVHITRVYLRTLYDGCVRKCIHGVSVTKFEYNLKLFVQTSFNDLGLLGYFMFNLDMTLM